MNTFKEAAIKILKENKKPLHYKEITQLSLEKGLIETKGSTPEATMNAQIAVDIKNRKKDSYFLRTRPGTFTLNPNRKEEPKRTKKEDAEEEKIKVEGGFIGKAGEHLVCSKLLFHGFNASIMSVDVGLDIVAVKNEKLFGIQVKTSNLNKFNIYVFDVRKVSFERHNNGNIFYIFVLHEESKNEESFIILPSYEIEKKIEERAIREVGGGKRYRINIKIRDGKVYLGNQNHEIGYFLDKWDLIK